MRTTANPLTVLLCCGLISACRTENLTPIPDAGELPDAAVVDAGAPDSGTPDAGMPDAGVLDSGTPDAGMPDAGRPPSRYSQQAYLKANNPGLGDFFGEWISVSSDGLSLVVGGKAEDGPGNSKSNSGAAYVFTRTGTAWAQDAYLRASDAGVNDELGRAVGISGDGAWVVVGAPGQASAAGAVYVFHRTPTGFVEDARLEAPTPVAGQEFGDSLAFSSDGNTLAIGAHFAQSKAGTVHVYRHTAGAWVHEAVLVASNPQAGDEFGHGLSLTANGDLLAVGAYNEDSASKGVGGAQVEGSTDSGAVYLFSRTGTAWAQQAYLKASNTGAGDGFGEVVALSLDGTTLAVGAEYEASKSKGVNGVETDRSAGAAGAVYVFRNGTPWTQEAYVKASNTNSDDYFGSGLALSGDGNTLVVGAGGESSNATGVNGDELNNDAFFTGAAYVFQRAGGAWSQETYLKASNSGEDDRLGIYVSLSADAGTLVIGAFGEGSGFTGSQSDNSAKEAGAVYVF